MALCMFVCMRECVCVCVCLPKKCICVERVIASSKRAAGTRRIVIVFYGLGAVVFSSLRVALNECSLLVRKNLKITYFT